MGYEIVNPNVWKPTKDGDEIEGILIATTPESGKFKSNIYNIETLNHTLMAVWGTKILDDKMRFVKIGERIKIVFKGVQKSKDKQEYNLYEVHKWKD